MSKFKLIDKKYNEIIWKKYNKNWYDEIIKGFKTSKRKPPNAILLEKGVIYDIRKNVFWLSDKKYNEIRNDS